MSSQSTRATAAGNDADESTFTFLPQGALIQEFKVAGVNIVQGFPEAKFYKTHNAPYFGETIGRTTNRIKDAKIENLNGKTYHLAVNNGPNSLHGGKEGWGKKDFEGPKPVNRNGKEGVEFKYLSKDGEEGYPGTVECRVWYTAGMEGGKTVLEAEWKVEFIGDECEETVVGVTNHRHDSLQAIIQQHYFNLNPSSPTIEGTIVTLGTNQYLPLDSTGIPHGNITAYPGIPAHKPFTLGATAPDLDDCFVMNPDPASIPLDTRSLPLKTLATLSHPATNLHLEISSTEPAFQFYTGKYVDVPAVEGAGARGARAGLCVEPSRYVDATREEWRSMCLVKRGGVWGAKSRWVAWKESM